MDKTKIYDLLQQKSEAFQKRMNRLLLFIYVFPLIYFMLDYSFISEVKTPIISFKQANFLLLTAPVIYGFLMVLIIVISNRIGDINLELRQHDAVSTNMTEKVKNLLLPFNLVVDLFDIKYSKGAFAIFGNLIIYLPLAIITFFSPIAFMSYIIYKNFKHQGEFASLSIWSAIVGIWIILALIIQVSELIKKDRLK